MTQLKATGDGRKKATSIWQSQLPPLPLARPMQVMGKTFEVHRSYPATFSVDTLSRAILDISLQQLVRDNFKSTHQSLKMMEYFVQGKHQLTPTSKRVILSVLGHEALRPDLQRALDGLPVGHVFTSDWALILAGMGEGDYSEIRFLVESLLWWDSYALNASRNRESSDIREWQLATEETLEQSLQSWHLLPTVNKLPVETYLRVLIDLEKKERASRKLPVRATSQFSEFLREGKRPMGHWFAMILQASNCDDLIELSTALHKKGALYLDRTISHDLLKKWSSSRDRLMPAKALGSVLQVVPITEDRMRLKSAYYLARVFTFICDFVWASSLQDLSDWSEAQAIIRAKYAALFEQDDALKLS